MPEGPEIRLEADRIATVLEGRAIDAAFFEQPRLRRAAARITGAQVTAVTTRGKAMLIAFDNDLTLYSHNQLYGRWYVRARDELPDTRRTLRVALHTAAGSALLYSASEIALLDPGELATHPFLSRLGPDALDATLTWRQLASRLLEPEFRGRRLHALLLDQSFLAGIGNYLRSEILFDAALAPAHRPDDLARRAVNALARSALAITRRAYDTRGVTNPPARVRMLKAAGKKRGGYRFAVFGRAGEPCYRCDKPITRETHSGRRLYWCRECQR